MSRTSVLKVQGLSRAETIEALRSRMHAMEGLAPQRMMLSVGSLDAVLPYSGLQQQAITEMADCPALAVDIISHVTANGSHVGIVGWPELSLAGIEHTSRVIVVPDPGDNPMGIAAVLSEGLDLVMWHLPTPLNLSPTRLRPLNARLRAGRAALIVVNASVPSAAARIDAHVCGYHGIGRGTGRILGYDIAVKEHTRGASTTIRIGQRPPLRAL